MNADARIQNELGSLLARIDAPPIDLAAIHRLIDKSVAGPRLRLRGAALAAAAVLGIVTFASPKTTLAVIEAIVVEGVQAANRVIGWTPPPAPPKALTSNAASQSATIAAAQSRVPFAIVPPSGLPKDAVPVGIRTAPVLAYSEKTRSWSKSLPAIWFQYRRSGGRTFDLMADVYDPRSGAPPKYMFEAEDLPGGRIRLVKHATFAWRNGNQVTSATAGNAITADEILAIRSAMHGIPIAPETGRLQGGSMVKQYRLPQGSSPP